MNCRLSRRSINGDDDNNDDDNDDYNKELKI